MIFLVGNHECNTERGFKNQLYIELGRQPSTYFSALRIKWVKNVDEIAIKNSFSQLVFKHGLQSRAGYNGTSPSFFKTLIHPKRN